MSNSSRSNRRGAGWGNQKIQGLKERWRKTVTSRNKSDFHLAKLLNQMRNALASGEFIKFCIDQDNGLGVASGTAYMYERMAEASASITAEPVWQAVGWDGIRKLMRVESRKERLTTCRAIMNEGGPVRSTGLDEILEVHAPSYKSPKASRGGGPSKAAALKENETLVAQNEILMRVLHRLVAKFPSLKRDLSQEEIAALGIAGGQMPKAS